MSSKARAATVGLHGQVDKRAASEQLSLLVSSLVASADGAWAALALHQRVELFSLKSSKHHGNLPVFEVHTTNPVPIPVHGFRCHSGMAVRHRGRPGMRCSHRGICAPLVSQVHKLFRYDTGCGISGVTQSCPNCHLLSVQDASRACQVHKWVSMLKKAAGFLLCECPCPCRMGAQ